MPHRRHQHPHVKCKLIGAALLEELPLEEHAGALAELDDGAGHAFLPEGKMRRGIERDILEGRNMTDLVHAVGSGVLAGHDVAAEIHCDGVFSVHPAFLP